MPRYKGATGYLDTSIYPETSERVIVKKNIKRKLNTAGRFGLYAGCGFISLFVLASGYESISNRSLPFVHTLAKVNLSVLSATYDLREASTLKPAIYGQFGKPVSLTMPSQTGTHRLSIVAPINDNGAWLARASAMHLLVPSKPLNGNLSTAILYCRASFRTINTDTLPVVGSNVFVDTDQSWRYVYKVTLSKAYTPTYPYFPSAYSSQTKGKLIIFCNDNAHVANDIIEADLISVQGITQ